MGKGGDSNVAASSNAAKDNAETSKTMTKYTWAEVKKHASPSDAWVVYNNRVYDVSDWYEHPGGTVIFTHAGDDMTDIFAAFHAPGSHNLMKKFLIGELIPESVEHKDSKQLDFEKAYRDLRSQLVVMGMFKSSIGFYIYKQASNLAMWATAMCLMYTCDSLLVQIAAALLMGLFFQQCGWLAHDFLHHQVYRNRRYGDYSGLFWET